MRHMASFLRCFLGIAVLVLTTAAINVSWGSCASAGPSAGHARDCAFISMPLDPEDPSGALITFFVRRYYNVAPTENALFMIQGGPGDSTLAFDGAAEYILQVGVGGWA